MGHAFNQTIMDALTRYHRMKGCNTLWVPGTDHAGIATQIVVERQLQDAGHQPPRPGAQELRRARVGVEAAQRQRSSPSRCAAWATASSWAHEYFTMDDKLSTVVTETFVRLYEEGLIYRGKRLVNWDPVLKSAVSDLEVESEEEDGFLWHIRYPLADGIGLAGGGHHAPGDDARRRGGDGAPARTSATPRWSASRCGCRCATATSR